jgi:hypothetical protein
MKNPIAAVLIIVLSSLWGCASTAAGPAPLLSKHHLFTIDPGVNWQLTTTLDQETELQMGRMDERAFIMVYAYNKQEMSNYPGLAQFAKLSAEQLGTRTTNATSLDKPVVTKIGGNPAMVYALAADVNNARVIYFSTTIEGQHALYWVIAWCLTADYEQVGDDLMKTFFSLRET